MPDTPDRYPEPDPDELNEVMSGPGPLMGAVPGGDDGSPHPALTLDPDCRDGKCGSCVGGPCEHECHQPSGEAPAAETVALPPDVPAGRVKPCGNTLPHGSHWWPSASVRRWCAGADENGLREIALPEAPAADPEAPSLESVAEHLGAMGRVANRMGTAARTAFVRGLTGATVGEDTTVRFRDDNPPRTIEIHGPGADDAVVTFRWLEDGTLAAEYDPARVTESARAVLDAVSTIVPPPEGDSEAPRGASAHGFYMCGEHGHFWIVNPDPENGPHCPKCFGVLEPVEAREVVTDLVCCASNYKVAADSVTNRVVLPILRTLAESSGASVPATPPGRSADEIRAAIADTIDADPDHSFMVDDLMTNVVGPLIAERDHHAEIEAAALKGWDAERQRADRKDWLISRWKAHYQNRIEKLTRRIETLRQRAERAEQQLIDCGADRDEQQRRASRAASMYSALRTQMRALCTCRATNDADGPDEDCPAHGREEFRAPVIARRLGEVEAERNRLREADARVRALAKGWIARGESAAMPSPFVARGREVLAALDGTDGGE